MCHKLVSAVFDYLETTSEKISSSARILALFYAHHVRPGQTAFHSNKFIETRTGLSEKSIQRAREELIEVGAMIEIRGRKQTREFALTFKPCADPSECREAPRQCGDHINKSEINKNNISNLSADAPVVEKSEVEKVVKKSPPPVKPSVSPPAAFRPRVDYSHLINQIGEAKAIAWKQNYILRKGGKMYPTQAVVDGMVFHLSRAKMAGCEPVHAIDYALSKGWATFEWEWAQKAFKSATNRDTRDISLQETLTDTSWADAPSLWDSIA